MPAKRTRRAEEATEPVHHPYKLRSLRKSTRENNAQDAPAHRVKKHKAEREQAFQVLDKKELRKFPVQQLRRFAAIKKVAGRRKQSIMLSLKRIYGDAVPLYPSEGRVEMREYSRDEYQVGRKRVIRVETFQELILKEEDIEDDSILKDAPNLRRSNRLRDRTQTTTSEQTANAPAKPRRKRG